MTDLASAAISRMRSPRDMDVICVDITNRCNLSCSNCTRLLANQDGLWDMTQDNFRTAIRTLQDFPGVIAVIGGNPVMHREFESICQILVEEIPEKRKRGLWTNNAYDHVDLAVEVFGHFNLNPHGDERGTASLTELYHKAEGAKNLYVGNSMHAPLLTAIRDIYDEEEMWDRISHCDINQEWSASIVQNKGELRAYFCEVAAAFDLAHGTDNGHLVEEGWWKQPIQSYENQIRTFCPGCGAAASFQPTIDSDDLDTYTTSNQVLVDRSLRRKRKVLLATPDELISQSRRVVAYNEEAIKGGRQLNVVDSVRHQWRQMRIRAGAIGLKIPGLRRLVNTGQ